MPPRRRGYTGSPVGKDPAVAFDDLRRRLLDDINKHPWSHETLGGERGLVRTSLVVFRRDESHFEDLYGFLCEVNPGVRALDDTKDGSMAKRRFRDAILNYPSGDTRARIFTILLDLGIALTSATWENFALHLNVRSPEDGTAELCDKKLPLSMGQIYDVFGNEHARAINDMQYKYCVPLTDHFEKAARNLEEAFSERFHRPEVPATNENPGWNGAHVGDFCLQTGPAEVVEKCPGLVKDFFIQCRLAKILSPNSDMIQRADQHEPRGDSRRDAQKILTGVKSVIAQQYKLMDEANLDAQKFLDGVASREKMLAILVHIRMFPTDSAWDRFFTMCLNVPMSGTRRDMQQDPPLAHLADCTLFDQDLPLVDAGTVSQHFGLDAHNAMKFINAQYLFCAAVLKTGKSLDISSHTLLPLSSAKLIGSGSSGKVFRVVIVRQHLVGKDGKSNHDPEVLAMKRSSPEDPNDWVELSWASKQKMDHKHIMKALAALTSPTEVFVFFPKAHSDLYHFMREASNWERLASDTSEKLHMLRHMSDIAGAIVYLHHFLTTEQEGHLVCIHKDLRADNILVTYEDGEMLLKITDFGLSSTQGAYTYQPSRETSWMNVLTSLRIGQQCSNFPPEALLTSKIDKRAGIWAFGTVYAEFVVWLWGGRDKLEEYVANRRLEGSEASFEMSHGKAVLRSTIRPYFQKIIKDTEETDERQLYGSSWQLLEEKLLICDPNYRADIKHTHEILRAICGKASTSSFFRRGQEVRATRASFASSESLRLERTLSPAVIVPVTAASTSAPSGSLVNTERRESTESRRLKRRFLPSFGKRPASGDRTDHRNDVVPQDNLQLLMDSITSRDDDEFNHQLTLTSHVDLNRQIAGETALDKAIEKSASRFVLKLLERGASPQSCGIKNGGALHRAAQRNLPEIVEHLVKYGADKDEDHDGRTPLLVAISHGKEQAAGKLLDLGADAHQCEGGSGWTSLHCAVELRTTHIAERIISIHEDLIDQPDIDRRTPLHECAKRSTSQTLKLARLLLERQCNVNAADIDQRTPLSLATDRWHPDSQKMVSLLLQHGADWGSGRPGAQWKKFEQLRNHGADVQSDSSRQQVSR